MNSPATTRRSMLRLLASAPVIAGIPRVFASDTDIPGFRKLADGRPKIGTAVPTHFARGFSAREMELLAKHFDSITPENCMKWHNLSPEPGKYHFEPVDELMDTAEKNGQTVVGHTLVFNREGNYPAWLLKNGDNEADPKLVWKRIEEHVGTLMTRYKGRIDSWDVLNEFVEAHPPGYRETGLARLLGPELPVRLFKLAAEIDPKAKLVYNDFGLESPDRRKVVAGFVRSLLDRGCRIDVVGSQSHLEIDIQDAGERIEAQIVGFAELGVRSAFTELDVDVIPRKHYRNSKTQAETAARNPYVDGCPPEVLEKQAAIYRSVFQAAMAHRNHVDRISFWGFADNHSWLNHWPWKRVNHALLFDRRMNAKPAFHAVNEALRDAS